MFEERNYRMNNCTYTTLVLYILYSVCLQFIITFCSCGNVALYYQAFYWRGGLNHNADGIRTREEVSVPVVFALQGNGYPLTTY